MKAILRPRNIVMEKGLKIIIDGHEHPPEMIYQFGLDETASHGKVYFDLKHLTVRFDSCDENTVKAFNKYDLSILPCNEASVAIWNNESVTVKRHLNMPPYINVIQFMLMFYIEAASYIDVKDPKWMIYTVHQTLSDRLIGFCSIYRFFKFPLGVRARISQFFILPEHQRRGHGRALYLSVINDLANDDQVKEVTVESPAESFSRLKIKCDAELSKDKSYLLSPRDKIVVSEYQKIKSKKLSDVDKKAIKARLAKEHEEQLFLDKNKREQLLQHLLCQEIMFYESI